MFFFACVLSGLFLFRIWLAGFGGVHPDEAYYWTWAQDLHIGYFDHPPMIAWLIRLGQSLVHHLVPATMQEAGPLFYARLGLRLVPLFLSSWLTPLLLGWCIEKAQSRSLRVSQMAVLATTPVFLFGPWVVTPDAPFFFAWTLCLGLCLKLQRSRDPLSRPGDPTPFSPGLALALGAALAFAAYSKHSAILAAFLVVMSGAGLLNSMAVGVTALVLSAPLLYWTFGPGAAQSAGAAFQLSHHLGDATTPARWQHAGDLLFSQFALWTPPIFLSTLLIPFYDFRSRLFVAQRRSRLVGTLFLWAALPLGFFTLTALHGPAEANWPLVGALSATVLALSRFRPRTSWFLLLFGINLSVAFFAFLFLVRGSTLANWVRPWRADLAAKLEGPSRLREFENWDRFRQLLFEATSSDPKPLEVQSYQVLSELLFHDSVVKENERFGSRLKIFTGGSRRSQFDLWPQYQLSDPNSPRWLLTRSEEGVPASCRLSQTLFKSPTDPQTFSVYRCGF